MRRTHLAVVAILAASAAAMPLRADDFEYEKLYYVRVGDPAPDFETRDDLGKTWRMRDHVGKKVVVLVFYQGDFFPACNKRLDAYRDYQAALTNLGAEIVAISGDPAANHELFRKTHQIKFTLLADIEAKAAKEYGVYASSGGITRVKDAEGKESRYKRGATMANWTFVVGLDGKVIYKDMKPDPTDDSRKVYEFLYRRATARR
jgi:peroxiredoxin Q/BCP